MRAFLFPGQGSQYVGMGLETYTESGTVRDIFDRANDVLGYRLSEIMFEGPEEELRQTRNAQPALFLHGYALYQMLENPQPAMAAGHSLGEYTALAVANALAFDDALRLVKVRAEAMQEAGEQAPGTMAAIIGLDDEVVKEVCAEVSSDGKVVQAANFNSSGQVVISGAPEAVYVAMDVAKERGARLAKELNVSGAFHSKLMQPAKERLAVALEETAINNADFPVYVNVSAEPVTDATMLRTALLQQLTAPVLWTRTIESMIEAGATEFVEVGPGTVLQKLVQRISRDVHAEGIESLKSVAGFNGATE